MTLVLLCVHNTDCLLCLHQRKSGPPRSHEGPVAFSRYLCDITASEQYVISRSAHLRPFTNALPVYRNSAPVSVKISRISGFSQISINADRNTVIIIITTTIIIIIIFKLLIILIFKLPREHIYRGSKKIIIALFHGSAKRKFSRFLSTTPWSQSKLPLQS